MPRGRADQSPGFLSRGSNGGGHRRAGCTEAAGAPATGRSLKRLQLYIMSGFRLAGLMLIRLFQHATICSVGACRVPRFRRICASFSVNSPAKRPARNTWRRVVGRRVRCPRCGHRRALSMAKHRRWQCAACRYQVSLTAGTILHNTKTPLTVWFWAAYLMSPTSGHLGAPAPTATGAAAVRNRVDAAAQAAARDGQRGA